MEILRRLWSALPFPDQVKRLIIIFSLLFSVWLTVRQHLVPPTFGEFGHYRAASVDSVAALPISYAGQTACAECHTDIYQLKLTSYHKDLSCEVCHGPGAKHTEDPTEVDLKPKPQAERQLCTVCHGYNPSRPTGFPQIDPVQHNPMQPCSDCHNPHDPTPPSTPGECGACHGQIARTKAVSHHAGLACTFCHKTPEAHKQTPRAALPEKPTTREFCGGCHSEKADSPKSIPRIDMDSHGGSHLCWECHYPHSPEAN